MFLNDAFTTSRVYALDAPPLRQLFEVASAEPAVDSDILFTLLGNCLGRGDPLPAAHALDPEAWLEEIPDASGKTEDEEKAQPASSEAVKADDKQSVLSQEEVNSLVMELEKLIGMSWRQAELSKPKRRPVYAAETLGRHLLAFDAIVCGIQLLGDKMQLPLWWNQYVAAFDHSPSHLLPYGSPKPEGIYRMMIRRLLGALEIYKRGKRPPLPEVIALKTMLFAHKDAPGRLKDHKWDPWREDAKGP
ncbi:uncharacterized protein EMH_0045120 [Eimeria mitis]|uniref:Uncharacterized protein n=1 Tax=Eimeria mitis TaxID=44415 RepID=U6K6R1_9EIME|nr:uncharacterized protein EMH_0045120 [Eimeria mitis]CDJ32516.1 hypothetical protein EMH_0045120 [Eimeria mitis]